MSSRLTTAFSVVLKRTLSNAHDPARRRRNSSRKRRFTDLIRRGDSYGENSELCLICQASLS